MIELLRNVSNENKVGKIGESLSLHLGCEPFVKQHYCDG